MRLRSILMTLVVTGLWLAWATPAFAGVMAPHVETATADTDICAMCHRGHSSASNVEFRRADGSDTTGNALIVGRFLGGSDKDLCLTCHGTGATGSESDVQTSLESSSAHSMAPTSSEFGPSPKSCSDCHDSHGTARDAAGDPYPALLRARDASGAPAYGGEAYCAACHDRHLTPGYSGVAVFRKTAHGSTLATPTSGTDIRCSVCHEGHGSQIAPLLRSTIVPPAVLDTITVSADDRTLCLACHAAPRATYGGENAYILSGHGMSSKAVSITAEWASEGATRTAGECQNCHAPMGRSDGAGGAIPKMAVDTGRKVCERCHSVKGPAGTDIASLSYPATAAADPELLAVYAPQVYDASNGRIELYSRETSGDAPYALQGPRAYSTLDRMGDAAAGDVDGDGSKELVVANRSSKSVDVWSDDGLGSLTSHSGPGHLSLEATADLIAVAEVIPNGGAAEVIAVSRDTGLARVYRYSGGTLSLLSGPFAVGTDPSSIAVGDVIGSSLPDVVVTSKGDDTFTVLEGGDTTVTASAAHATGNEPTGASVGDVWPGGTKQEIVILNSGEASGQVSIFSGDGAARHDYDTNGPASAVPTASAIGDALPGITSIGTSGKEIVVAMDGGTGQSGFDVFAQVEGGGLAAAFVYNTGPGYRTGSTTLADVDGDGRAEVLVGNGGKWATDGTGVPPSAQIWESVADGQSLNAAAASTLWAGGMELAGGAPSLLSADLGDIGPSRHASLAVTGSHVSTETQGFARHVTCTDCHEVHESTSATAAAPAVYGSLKGAWGVSVENISTSTINASQKQGVQYEYQVCLKCHSGWIDLAGRRDMAFEFNEKNASVHAVEKAASTSEANAGSFESGWDNSSVLYCADCHGDADASQAKGPHTSSEAPLLKKPYFGDLPSDDNGLCYGCHKYAVYYDGTADSGGSASLFGSAADSQLHKAHVKDRGLGCSSCHVSHGSTDLPHLMRPGIGFADNGSGASCNNECHGGATKSYTRP